MELITFICLQRPLPPTLHKFITNSLRAARHLRGKAKKRERRELKQRQMKLSTLTLSSACTHLAGSCDLLLIFYLSGPCSAAAVRPPMPRPFIRRTHGVCVILPHCVLLPSFKSSGNSILDVFFLFQLTRFNQYAACTP